MPKILNPTWLDEIGLKSGLLRFKNENIEDYRIRLTSHIHNLPESNQASFLEKLSTLIGEENIELFNIDLVKDEKGIPVAEDPRIEITSSFLKVWKNYEETKDNPDLSLDIHNKEESYFLKDVYEKLITLDFIVVEPLTWNKGLHYYKSKNLAYSNTDGYTYSFPLSGIKINELPNQYIKNAIFSSKFRYSIDVGYLIHEQLDREDGDYHLDKVNGIVFSSLIGGGEVSYSYRKFPFKIKWEFIRSLPVNDSDIDFIFKNNLIGKEGLPERLLLNGYGAKINNEILAIHSLQWGK